MNPPASSRYRLLFTAACLSAVVLRIGWLLALEDNWDLSTYRDFVEFAGRGGGLYRDIASYHFSPPWAFFLRGLAPAAALTGIPFEKAVGFALLLVDAASAWLLYKIARRNLLRSAPGAAAAALLFFANPVSVFTTGFHAQFENLSILFLLAAVFWADREPARPLPVLGFLAASLMAKHFTWFHPLLFANRLGKRGLSSLTVFVPYAIFFASFLPYWSVRDAVAERVLRHQSLAEDYGVAMLRQLPGVPDWAPLALFVVAAFSGVFAFRRLEIARACLLLFLLLLIFLPGIVQYYFVWPIALGSLFGGAGYAVFTLTVSAFFLGSPDGLNLPLAHLPGWHGVWWSAVFWLLWEMRGLATRKEA